MNDPLLLTCVLIVRYLWVVWYQSIKYHLYNRVDNQDSLTEMCQHEYLQCDPIPDCFRPVHILLPNNLFFPFKLCNKCVTCMGYTCCKLKDNIFYPPVPAFQVAALEEVSSLKLCVHFSMPHRATQVCQNIHKLTTLIILLITP